MQFLVFEVDKVAPTPFWPSNVRDGAVLTQDTEGCVIVAIYLHKPTEKELQDLNRPIAARFMVREDGCGLWFMGYGDKPLIFELTQNPTLYDIDNIDDRLKAWVTHDLWHIVVIDTSTGKVLINRLATAPEDLRKSIFVAMYKALGTQDFHNIYKEYLSYFPYRKKA